MPNAPKKPCAYGGCPNLVDHGYCEIHKAAASHVVDQHREWQSLYNTRLWRRISQRQLTKEPWCAECLRANIYTPATECDHINPHRGDKEKFFKGPFQSLCKPCHSKKTNEELGRGGKNV